MIPQWDTLTWNLVCAPTAIRELKLCTIGGYDLNEKEGSIIHLLCTHWNETLDLLPLEIGELKPCLICVYNMKSGSKCSRASKLRAWRHSTSLSRDKIIFGICKRRNCDDVLWEIINSKRSDWSIEMLLPALLRNYDRPTDQPTDTVSLTAMRVHGGRYTVV